MVAKSKPEPTECNHVGYMVTKYRGNLADGSIERCVGGVWSVVPARDDLIPYHVDDVRRAALAVLCDATGDDWGALLLHNLLCHYYDLDTLEGDRWRVNAKNIAAWLSKKLRKLIGTPRYIAPPQVWDALERLHQVDAEKFPLLPAIHDPSLTGVRRGEKKKRRRNSALEGVKQ